jgi:hypothetical protein
VEVVRNLEVEAGHVDGQFTASPCDCGNHYALSAC